MAWEQGGGFLSNLGGLLSGIGKGGGGFMGNFGTGEGALAGWSPFQNVKQGQGLFGKEGGFGSGQGQLAQMFGGGEQDVSGQDSRFLTEEALAAHNQNLKDQYGATFQDVTGEDASGGADPLESFNILDQVKGISDASSKPPLFNLQESPLGSTPGTPGYTGEGWAGETPVAPIVQDSTEVSDPNEFLSNQPVYGAENQGVQDYNAQFGTQDSGTEGVDPNVNQFGVDMSIYDTPTAGQDANVNQFGVDQTPYQTPVAEDSSVTGPGNLHQMIARISEGGSRHAIRKDIDPLLEAEGLDKTKGFFGSAWDKLGGIKGIMGTVLGAKAAGMQDEEEGDFEAAGIEQPEYDPLQLYGGGIGGGGGNWADVTGTNYLQGAQFNPLSQGLAGYYNPKLRELR